ncbi:unnamed protein product [Brassica oleracea var. botrytis]
MRLFIKLLSSRLSRLPRVTAASFIFWLSPPSQVTAGLALLPFSRHRRLLFNPRRCLPLCHSAVNLRESRYFLV